MKLLRTYTLGDKPIAIEFLSDQSLNFQESLNQTVNFEDPNINIACPVFSIHGNHDDPSGNSRWINLNIFSNIILIFCPLHRIWTTQLFGFALHQRTGQLFRTLDGSDENQHFAYSASQRQNPAGSLRPQLYSRRPSCPALWGVQSRSWTSRSWDRGLVQRYGSPSKSRRSRTEELFAGENLTRFYEFIRLGSWTWLSHCSGGERYPWILCDTARIVGGHFAERGRVAGQAYRVAADSRNEL